MSRAVEFNLQPADKGEGGRSELQLYVYELRNGKGEWFPGDMAEHVYMSYRIPHGFLNLELRPAEARQAALYLVACADKAEENRQRRESLEEIEEQLRDPDFRADQVTFCHPDVVYVTPGEFEAASKAHPGKLLIAREAVTP